MDLYLIRHADALPPGERNIVDDADRPLSEKGKKQSRALGRALHAKAIRPGKVLTSPLLRARQTAEEILHGWPKPVPELQVCHPLEPGFKPTDLAELLCEFTEECVAMVGHQPDLGQWAAWLIGSRKARIDFAKAGVAHIVCSERPGKGAGTLVWLLTPEWL